ncbi:hypothetical protein OAG68_02520 [bacterium]|nr:hypothetical protein [bacterium]
MLFAETAVERQTVMLIVLVIIAGIFAAVLVVSRLVSFLMDNDSEGVWAIAIDPKKYDDQWESNFDCAVSCDRICGVSYFSNIWPASVVRNLEDGVMYDRGIEYRGEKQILDVIAKAEKYWCRKRIYATIPSIRRRLDHQLNAFCNLANFAKSKKLILLLVFVDADDAPIKTPKTDIAT